MLQYSVLYCNRLQEAKLYRNTKLYCDSGLGVGRWLGAQGARGAHRRGAGRAGGALGEQAASAGVRAGVRARGRARGRQAAACGACAEGARPGRACWPWAVHLVHSAYFRSVLTRYCS